MKSATPRNAEHTNKATARETAGPGFTFEDFVAAMLATKILTGEALPAVGIACNIIQSQTDALRWQIDDLLITAETDDSHLALFCKSNGTVHAAYHGVAIDRSALVEAFPSAFLGLMIKNPADLSARRADRSDTFFAHLAATGDLSALIQHCIPGRQLASNAAHITNHDDQAVFVCALTALSVVAGDFVAVGDKWMAGSFCLRGSSSSTQNGNYWNLMQANRKQVRFTSLRDLMRLKI